MKLFYSSFIILLVLGSSVNTYAKKRGEFIPQFEIVKNERDPNLSNQESIFIFNFKNIPLPAKLRASCNKIERSIQTSGTGEFCLKTIPGKYMFQFFYTNEYYEIYTDSIEVKPGYRIEININFESSLYPVMMDKPVIYCYPERPTKVHIELSLKGEMVFTYPNYNNGWSFTADQAGTIQMDHQNYKYLFWEGTTNINFQTVNWKEGSIVGKNDLLAYLESSLTQMGMNSMERQDFITYWYPSMVKNEKNYIHFAFNEEYNEYAKISVDPQPDHMLRVYMLWADASKTKQVQLTKQVFTPIKREGFTLIEWGGSPLTEMPPVDQKSAVIN